MIPASDGVKVPAHIYRPKDMGAQPNGAAVIFVHGAGYLHNVGNFWSQYPREYMFNQFLATQGLRRPRPRLSRVGGLRPRLAHGDLSLDGRARPAGPGRRVEVSAEELRDRSGKRIGIYGGSYGGFITLMALFTAAATTSAPARRCAASPTGRTTIDGYTSTILNLPQDDTLAYRRSSPIYFAEGLREPLLMAHGMVDTNVHFQDIVRLTQRLIELGKTDWELAAYPVEDHGFVRPTRGRTSTAGSSTSSSDDRAPGTVTAVTLGQIGQVVRRIVGAPDYDTYLEHVRRKHPDLEPLSEKDFLRQRLRGPV